MFYPQSAPFSQAKTIPTGTRPCHRGTKRPSSLCSRDCLQFQARTAQWGRGCHVIFKLEDKVVLVQAFVSGGRPLVA